MPPLIETLIEKKVKEFDDSFGDRWATRKEYADFLRESLFEVSQEAEKAAVREIWELLDPDKVHRLDQGINTRNRVYHWAKEKGIDLPEYSLTPKQ